MQPSPHRRASLGLLRVLPILAPVVLAPVALAQGSRADHERSANLRARFSDLLVEHDPQLAWDPDGRHAVALRHDDAGKQVAAVLDLESGEVERTVSLDEAGGGVDRMVLVAGNLVLWDREQDAAWFTPVGGGEGRAVELTEVPELLARESGPQERSSRSTDRSWIAILNRGDVPLTVDWVDSDGELRNYATLAPGERFASSSFVGHVWEVRAGETVLGRCAVAEQACAAVVEGGELKVANRRRGDDPRREAPRIAGRDTRPYRIEVREHDVWLSVRGADEWTRLTDDGTEQDGYGGRVVWSPDGLRAVVLRTRRGTERRVHYVEAAPRDQLQPKLHSYDYRKPGDEIDLRRPLLVDCEAGTAVLVDDSLFPNPWGLDDLRWAPDGTQFTFRHNQRGHQVLRMIAVDAKTARPRVLVDETAETFVDYSQKAWHRWLDERQDLLWASERSGWNHLYRFDSRTGRLRNAVTKGDWVLRGVDRVDEEAGQVWFRALGVYPDQDPYHVHHGRVDLDGRNLVWLTEGDGTHEIELSPDGRFLVDRYSRVDLPPVTELRRTADGSLVCELARADDTALRAAGWAPPERFVAKGRDGATDIWGVIHRPTNFDPDGSYPVIESIYAGPHDHHVPKRFRVHSRQAELAELGFVVVQIDGMGTNWRSRAFHDVAWKNLADAGLPDRKLWIEAAAREHPGLDLARVGIYGGSAGGQNALGALLSHGDFYKVAVADCGCHDNRMDKIWWNEAWMGWPIGPHYEEQSNVTRAHRLEGKLLLVVGEKDENVDPASTMQVVDALVRADKDFDLLVIPGAGHGAAESPYGTRRRRDFFIRHLLGVEPRWE